LYKIPRLHKEAIPCIFPNCPKYLTKQLKLRKAPTLRNSPIKRKLITVDTLNPSNEIIDLPEYIECFDNNKPNTQNEVPKLLY
jgi:hypothetical protein